MDDKRPEQAPFPIYRLPPEIRLQIWTLAFLAYPELHFRLLATDSNQSEYLSYVPLDITTRSGLKTEAQAGICRLMESYLRWKSGDIRPVVPDRDAPHDESDFECMNLFLASRQTYREVARLFYGETHFVFTHMYQNNKHAAQLFLADRTAYALESIRHLSLLFSSDTSQSWGTESQNSQAWNALMATMAKMRLEHLRFSYFKAKCPFRPSDEEAVPIFPAGEEWINDVALLPKVKRLDLEVTVENVQPWIHSAEEITPAHEVAQVCHWVKTVRSSILINGVDRGYDNIRLQLLKDRLNDQQLIVGCDDDESGRSYLFVNEEVPRLHDWPDSADATGNAQHSEATGGEQEGDGNEQEEDGDEQEVGRSEQEEQGDGSENAVPALAKPVGKSKEYTKKRLEMYFQGQSWLGNVRYVEAYLRLTETLQINLKDIKSQTETWGRPA